MLRLQAFAPLAFRLATLVFLVVRTTAGAPLAHVTATESTEPVAATTSYEWKVNEKESPLLGFPDDRINPGLDRLLFYPFQQFRFPILQPLAYDDERNRYLLPLLGPNGADHLIEFVLTNTKNTYSSTDGANIQLIDNDSMKTIRTHEGPRYVFVRYPDGEFRCAAIKEVSGVTLNLLYTANGLMLHGIVDSSGRSVTFKYEAAGIVAVTQTWTASAEGLTKTWRIADPPKRIDAEIKYSHFSALKTLPLDAVLLHYSSEMAAADKMLAQIFGGPNAVAGANGFEPPGLAASYPFYRGNTIGDDGIERRGHLSYAMHLYGSADGTGDSHLYVPTGFTVHSVRPSPTDAVVTFYYPRLGNLTDVTLAVFHVADFEIRDEGGRVRIGNLGGPGGASPSYKHSHIEFYQGNTGLPPLPARVRLRIDPVKVFTARTD